MRHAAGCGREGFALIAALVLLLLCASIAVAWVNTTSVGVAQADSLHKVTGAQLAAESGMQFMMHHMAQLEMDSGVSCQALLDELASAMATRFNGMAAMGQGGIQYDGQTISTPSIDVGDGRRSFLANLTLVGADTVMVTVTGTDSGIRRTLGVECTAITGDSPVFDFGIASRSPVELTGNAKVEGKNDAIEARILSATDEAEAFDLTGNVQLDGDIYTTNPGALVSMTGNVAIGGESCRDPAVWDHIHLGLGVGEFPEVDPTVYEPFATNIVDSSTRTSGNKTFSNIRIRANTNPTFSGNIQMYGVIFIEAPNRVHFSGNTTFTGVIVTEDAGEGVYDTNTVKFTGNMSAQGVEQLPDTPEYHELRNMPGAFILAPGFGLEFTGNFGTVSGCMAADSYKFTGNAGGTVKGGIINYSDSRFKLTGNSRIIIDRDGAPETPPGFVTCFELKFSPSSYVEYGAGY